MSEGNWLPDTAYLGTHWCPDCEPGRDPTVEILETRYCINHEPHTPGSADALALTSGRALSGAGLDEAEAIACRAVQTLIR
jgi:hypothetical protein